MRSELFQRLVLFGLLAFSFALLTGSTLAHGNPPPSQYGLFEGDLVRASEDPDVYIVNRDGFKRLILSPAVFSYYAHLTTQPVKVVSRAIVDAFPTTPLLRNCETGDPRVYAIEVVGEDGAVRHWINMTAEAALAEDHHFFEKVFCINSREFGLYSVSGEYTSLSQIPVYQRENLPPPAINETNIPLTIPDGFKVSVFTPQALGPIRLMAFAPDGVLFVTKPSTAGLYKGRGGGTVYALPDRNGDGKADEAKAVITNRDNLPHGIGFYNNYLYIAEENNVSRYPYLGNAAIGAREIVVSGLPTGGEHISRSLTFSPDAKMFVSVGSTCNACAESDARRAAILRYEADGTGGRIFAQGLRNSVGLAFNPATGALWATDNGRDFLGDNLPPDEVNIIGDNAHYGWPYCYGKQVKDSGISSSSGLCATTQPTIADLQAHSAALGLRFIDSGQFPAGWQGDILVAFHGSWNRTVPTGYKVVRLDVSGNTIVGVSDFITGWLQSNGSSLGRPVDVVFGPDGALYISDDKANVIYRMVKI